MEEMEKIATSNKTDPSKHYTNFIYKAVIASVFLYILPILPSQFPEFVNQSRSWELLQLLFVGLAVSYGLFSRKNNETEKENLANFDNAHTYISRFLQISSVFDEETNYLTASDESKVQTWNNQYHREEPMLVLAQKNSIFEEQSGVNSVYPEKPLLLPIRSLKSRVSEPDKTMEPSKKIINTNSSSNSGSKRFPNDYENFEEGKTEDFNSIDLGLKSKDDVVLRSPIPWRSRSGRMEMRENMEPTPLLSLDSETEDSVSEPLESPSFMPQFSLTSKSSSRNMFSEQLPKNGENLARKNIYQKGRTPPPAPPPPPPPRHRKPPLGRSGFISKKELKREEIEEIENLGVGSDEETEDNEIKGEKEEEILSNGGSDLGTDVNKKADEFIAKFREQIRLQKIESIRHIGRNSSR